ncbi:MAG: type pantothenate kinase [Desulfuromonadales bacterium]|jgi:type III pantothenate kinase|nr:type pantothenate kinase [Desulfuromonadales bacterium]
MLLVIDVGNTNTVVGLYEGQTLAYNWRITTDKGRTGDEYALLLHELLRLAGETFDTIEDVIVSSVVPPTLYAIEALCRKYVGRSPYVVGPGIKTGMPILYEHPREVGADRIVNAVAAFARWQCSLIVVDFGTATTFDYITAKGQYQGGAIAPGLKISADALFEKASKLPRVEVARPPGVVAKNTVSSIQAGLFYGYVGLVDGIVGRMKKETRDDPLVVATGGLATLIANETQAIDEVEPDLTLEGLRILYLRNKG